MPSSRINLLPPSKKELSDKLIKFIFFKEMVEVILLVAAFLSVILLWSWYVLQNQFNDLSQSAMLVNREYSHYNQEIRKLNSVVKQFNTANKSYYPLSPKILELIEKLPNNIKINSISIDRKNNSVAISGVAKTRDALLSYQALLKNYSWLSAIQTPTSQLFQKENVNFEMKAIPNNFPPLNDAKPTKPSVERDSQ